MQHADSDDLSKQLRQEINLLTSELHAIRKEAKTTRYPEGAVLSPKGATS